MILSLSLSLSTLLCSCSFSPLFCLWDRLICSVVNILYF